LWITTTLAGWRGSGVGRDGGQTTGWRDGRGAPDTAADPSPDEIVPPILLAPSIGHDGTGVSVDLKKRRCRTGIEPTTSPNRPEAAAIDRATAGRG
jgi:hypothetical protein